MLMNSAGSNAHPDTAAHAFCFQNLDGSSLSLRDFAGKPILIVNTASECGFASQFGALQELWDRYRAQGLLVIGVPCNDFGEQEPHSNAEIGALCAHYGITFPVTVKTEIIGGNAHPFYRWLADELGEGAVPRWNFHKYLIDGRGHFAGLWAPETNPLDHAVVEPIERLSRGIGR